MLSVQIIDPSSGKTNTSSGPADEARSPDQTIAAQVSPLAEVRQVLVAGERPDVSAVDQRLEVVVDDLGVVDGHLFGRVGRRLTLRLEGEVDQGQRVAHLGQERDLAG